MSGLREQLENVEIAGGGEGAERAWTAVATSFASRERVAPPSRQRYAALALAVAVAAVAGAVASPAGRAVIDRVREVVGVEKAQPALFSLPAAGRLLAASERGVWVVAADGSKRLLGPYREASWSPFGRFLVATRRNELAALEPSGRVRWTLARRGARGARWTGTRTDTRIAYVAADGIRVVAGDGTGDRLLVPGARGPLAWWPGPGFVLAYAGARNVHLLDVSTGRVEWSVPRPGGPVTTIAWSRDGRRLLILTPHHLRVVDRLGRVVGQEDPSDGTRDVAAAFRPGSRTPAVTRVHGSQSSTYYLAGDTLFRRAGRFRELAWSPDGRWLVIGWPAADQWVFVRADGRRVRAVANLATAFQSGRAPRVLEWCCPAGG